MKYLLLLFLLPITLTAQHRTIGKTIFLDKPNGQAIFYLNNDIAVNVYDEDDDVTKIERASGWKKVYPKFQYLLKANIKKNILQQNSKIFDNKQKEIGRTLQQINVSNFIDSSKKYGDTMEIYFYGFAKMTTIKELSFNELLKRETIPFATQNENNFIVIGDTNTENYLHFKSIETSYKILDALGTWDDDKNRYMMLKKRIYTDSYLNSDEREITHNISVTVYPNIYKKDSFVFAREHVHTVELINDYKEFKYWEVKTYGCCMDPTKIELVKFPSNQTLFTCNYGYYDIGFAGINDFILLGFETKRGEGKNENLVGELGYTINGEKSGKVIFRTKRKEDAYTIHGEDIAINFIQIDTTDRIFDWEKSTRSICYDWYNEDYNWYSRDKSNLKENKFKSVYQASGIGVEFTFEAWINSKKIVRKAKVIFNKGEVKDKEIYLDFD